MWTCHLRDLAESTGGFLIGDSNDLRQPLRRVNEEISSYYELSYNPDIENYDGSFRKLAVAANRKDLVIHSRTGYFALPPEARAAGLAPFELPLLKTLSEGKLSDDVEIPRQRRLLLQPKKRCHRGRDSAGSAAARTARPRPLRAPSMCTAPWRRWSRTPRARWSRRSPAIGRSM